MYMQSNINTDFIANRCLNWVPEISLIDKICNIKHKETRIAYSQAEF